MTIIQADILQWAEEYDGPPFHAAFCDAPYHLTEMNKRYGSPDAEPCGYGNDGAFRRVSSGFMGKQWDGGDIAFRSETWRAIARHIYPGGFIVSFAGSRGWHRMACAMEDAGLIIHPTVFLWSYGSGFPKATRIDAQIAEDAFRAWLSDHPAERAELRALEQAYAEARRAHKANPRKKAERDAALNALRLAERDLKLRSGVYTYAGQKKHAPKFDAEGHGYREKDNGYNSKERTHYDVLMPVAEEAQRWAGHRYGGQVLKPAVEPLIVAQKPYEGRPVDCITRTGAGALNVDGGRVGAETNTIRSKGNNPNSSGAFPHSDDNWIPHVAEAGHIGKRWPANLLLSHTPQCRAVGSRKVKGTRGEADYTPGAPASIPAGCAGGTIKTGRHYADAEGYETVAAWACAEGCPVAALDRQSGVSAGHRNTESDNRQAPFYQAGGTATGGYSGRRDPLNSYGDSGGASRFFHQSHWAYEIEERIASADPVRYCAKASKSEREAGLDPMQIKLLGMMDVFDETTVDDGRETPIDNPYQRGETKRRNPHPCIKPLSVTRYLATLLLPPDHYAPRRILVPFSGVASEYIGAVLAGWDEVVGVELSEEYIKIAEARAAFWQALRYRLLDPSADLGVSLSDDEAGQLSLWEAA